MSDMHTIFILLALAGLASSVIIELARSRRETRLWEEHLRRIGQESC